MQATNERSTPDFQIIGGVGTVALINPDTTIDVDRKEVVAPSSLFLSNRREGGTLRDLDILVLSSDPNKIHRINSIVSDTVGDKLEPSVSNIKPEKALQQQLRKPLGMTAIKSFLSYRYEYKGNIVKALFPFAVPIAPESLETWTLKVKDMKIPIPNPAMSISSYLNRSVIGLRPKDREKVNKMATNVFSKAPELMEWVTKGPGANQVDLGLLLRSLTPYRRHDDIFNLKKPILPMSNLAEHEYFMLPESSPMMKRMIIGQTAIKALLLYGIESNKTIGTFLRQFAQHHPGLVSNNEINID